MLESMDSQMDVLLWGKKDIDFEYTTSWAGGHDHSGVDIDAFVCGCCEINYERMRGRRWRCEHRRERHEH